MTDIRYRTKQHSPREDAGTDKLTYLNEGIAVPGKYYQRGYMIKYGLKIPLSLKVFSALLFTKVMD